MVCKLGSPVHRGAVLVQTARADPSAKVEPAEELSGIIQTVEEPYQDMESLPPKNGRTTRDM